MMELKAILYLLILCRLFEILRAVIIVLCVMAAAVLLGLVIWAIVRRERKCRSCFRCVEDWRDAKRRGLPIRKKTAKHLAMYSYTPRPGVAVIGIGVGCYEPMKPDSPACEDHVSRWRWNVNRWWKFVVRRGIRRAFEKYIRVPVGKLRRPLPVAYGTMAGLGDKPYTYPECPRCHEMVYEETYCVFCGQRFMRGDGQQKQSESRGEAFEKAGHAIQKFAKAYMGAEDTNDTDG